MSEHFKLRQGHFVGHAHRVWSLIPLISDVSHRITNWGNHKHTSNVLVPAFGAYVQDPPITSRPRAPVDCIIIFYVHTVYMTYGIVLRALPAFAALHIYRNNAFVVIDLLCVMRLS